MKLFVLVLVTVSAAWGQVPASNHVWVITEENHSFEEVIGNPDMPFYNRLATQHGLAAQYYSNRHNSISALMWLVAGQEVTTDNATTNCFDVNNLVRGILSRKLTWKSYQEDLPYPGFQGVTWLAYARRHNPLIDFTDTCAASQSLNSVPFTQLATDMAKNATPNFIYITPNLEDDSHDGPLAQADQWLAQNVPAILARPEFSPGGDGLLFIVWDEGNLKTDNRCSARLNSGCGGRVPTLLIGPQLRPHYQSSTRYDHANLLRTICDAMGISSCPGEAAVALPMTDFFETVKVTAPVSNSTVASPVHVQARAGNSSAKAMQVYVDDVVVYQIGGAAVDTLVTLKPGGEHHIVVQSWDPDGVHKNGTYVIVAFEAVIVNSLLPNAIVSSPVPVSATGGGASQVHTMQVYVDDVLAYQVNSNAVKIVLPLKNGVHNVVVQAWDDSGGVTKTPVNINVASPAVTISQPLQKASSYSPVVVDAAAVDPATVYATQLYVDNALTYEFSGSGVKVPIAIPPGTHSLVVQAWDVAGGIYKSSRTIKINPVQVRIASPAGGITCNSPVKIAASVSDGSPVYVMQVYVDGKMQYQTNGTRVNTSLSINRGEHIIEIWAWDNGGSFWKNSVQITVED